MQPLYTKTEFKAAKSRQLLPLRCLHCAKTFHRTKHDIQLSSLPHRFETNEFCSNLCQRHHQEPLIPVICEQCQESFTKEQNQVIRTKHHFCSHHCHAIWQNAHKMKGTKCSKLEVWLSKQLPKLYPVLEFHFNRKDAINGELDIFIPSLKLAFELNGIFHYEPIFGKDKLASIQTNDHRKMLACAEHGIELCLIDISHQKYFKEQSSMRFLQIIQNIINAKLSGSSPVAFATA
jgi:hypothetical protein